MRFLAGCRPCSLGSHWPHFCPGVSPLALLLILILISRSAASAWEAPALATRGNASLIRPATFSRSRSQNPSSICGTPYQIPWLSASIYRSCHWPTVPPPLVPLHLLDPRAPRASCPQIRSKKPGRSCAFIPQTAHSAADFPRRSGTLRSSSYLVSLPGRSELRNDLLLFVRKVKVQELGSHFPLPNARHSSPLRKASMHSSTLSNFGVVFWSLEWSILMRLRLAGFANLTGVGSWDLGV